MSEHDQQDDHRDPTAPPPLPEDTRAHETSATRPLTSPSGKDSNPEGAGSARTQEVPAEPAPDWGPPAPPPPPSFPPPPYFQPPPSSGPAPYPQPSQALPSYDPEPPPPVWSQPAGASSYGAQPYETQQNNTSAVVLTILSGLSVVVCGGLSLLPALVFGFIGLVKQSSDPVASATAARRGWWAFGIGWVVAILVVVALIVYVLNIDLNDTSGSTYEGY